MNTKITKAQAIYEHRLRTGDTQTVTAQKLNITQAWVSLACRRLAEKANLPVIVDARPGVRT